MFDLVEGKARHLPSGGVVPVLTTSAMYLGMVTAIAVVPLLFMTDVIPEVPTMIAFVAAEPPAPPPLPPPPAPAKPRPQEPARSRPVSASSPIQAAPVDAPPTIEPETVVAQIGEGVEGGVEGGVPGGVAGGVVGIPDVPAPPSPPVESAPRAPVRVGGKIKQPALIQRVEPVYPAFAAQVRIEGTVILEAIVDEDGEVRSVKVLRSVPLLDRAAITAVQQWRYSPVVLNGTPVPFMLTVVMTFSLPDESKPGRY